MNVTGVLRRILAFLIAATIMYGVQNSLVSLGMRPVFGMGATQFGTYSKTHADRQKRKSDLCYRGARLCDCKTHVCEGVRGRTVSGHALMLVPVRKVP